MVFSIKRNSAQKKEDFLNLEEAYNLWDIVNSKYDLIDTILIWQNYTHDVDFKILISRILTRTEKAATRLEGELKYYGLPASDKPRAGIKTMANSEVITDQKIAKSILTMVQEILELILRGVRTSTTNDNIRSVFVKQVDGVLEDMDLMLKYVKAKSWLAQPPIYPNTPKESKEELDIGEAFHLWDHLTFRYDSIQQTQVWYEYTHDGDFKLLLKKGLQSILKKEATMLEKEILNFGIPMPTHPSEIIQTSKETGLFNDDYMFRLLYIGMVGAMWLHSIAVKQCTTNERIRKIFVNLLTREVSDLDKLILYGKSKGWLNIVPQYR